MSLEKRNLVTQKVALCKPPLMPKKKKVLAFKNAVHFPGASVECFVKVQVCVHSVKICVILISCLWWQKAPICSNPNIQSIDNDSADACYGVAFTIEQRQSYVAQGFGPKPCFLRCLRYQYFTLQLVYAYRCWCFSTIGWVLVEQMYHLKVSHLLIPSIYLM